MPPPVNSEAKQLIYVETKAHWRLDLLPITKYKGGWIIRRGKELREIEGTERDVRG